jgi:hypothetical protein
MKMQDVNRALFVAVFSVLRSAAEGKLMKAFLELKVSDLLRNASPTGWPSFWQEVLTDHIRREFKSWGFSIAQFDPAWFDDGQKSMTDLGVHIFGNLVEI